MKRELRITKDGSSTFFVEELDEHYHSIHGAVQESKHVFIEAGLNDRPEKGLSILEIGFGTGLNAWLTANAAAEKGIQVNYTALEKYPLNEDEWQGLNYAGTKELGTASLLKHINKSAWELPVDITDHFTLEKRKTDLLNFTSKERFHLIYFDAFAPSAQPDLWSIAVFESMYNALLPGGILVTYCAKGQVKRNMKAAGFTIEPLPGPPGKREMTRARKEI